MKRRFYTLGDSAFHLVACRRAARFGATVLPPPGGRLGRPAGRAATARSAAGRSPAQPASSGRRSAPLRPRSAPRWRLLVEFVASALRPCGPSSASLPFAVRPLPPPASANPRAGLRRRGAGFSPRAPFAARAPNRVRPSLSARRSAVPPAPHATSLPDRRTLPCLLTVADAREAAAQAARGPEGPTVAREERRDRLSPRCLRLRKRILPRGMPRHARLTDVWRQVRLPERRVGRAVGPTGQDADDCRISKRRRLSC